MARPRDWTPPLRAWPVLLVAASGSCISALLAGLSHALIRSRRRALQLADELDARQQAEQARDVALAKYQTLFENFPLGITVSDRKGQILEVNAAGHALLGFPRDEHLRGNLDSPVWHLLRRDGTPLAAEEFPGVRALGENEGPQRGELGIVRPDGTVTWLAVTAARLPLAGGVVVVTYGDITQSVSDAMVRKTVSAILELAAVSDSPARFHQELPRLLATRLGFPAALLARHEAARGELIIAGGAGLPSDCLGLQVPVAQTWAAQVLQSREPCRAPEAGWLPEPLCAYLQTLDMVPCISVPLTLGERPWGVLVLADTRRRPDAPWLASTLVAVADALTEAGARLEAQQALRENEARLRLAWQATREVIWDWDIEHDEQRWNEAGAATFGWTDAVQAPQTGAWWAERVHQDDRERVAEGFHRALDDRACERWEDEYRFLCSDGRVANVLDRGCILRDASGKPKRMIGAMQDLTDLWRAQEALREADRRKDAFLATLGHELRNPLAPIRNACAILKLAGGSDPTLVAARELIDRQVRHLVRLIDDLLDVSRISRGKLQLRPGAARSGDAATRRPRNLPSVARHPLGAHAEHRRRHRLAARKRPRAQHRRQLRCPLGQAGGACNRAGAPEVDSPAKAAGHVRAAPRRPGARRFAPVTSTSRPDRSWPSRHPGRCRESASIQPLREGRRPPHEPPAAPRSRRWFRLPGYWTSRSRPPSG